MSKLSLSSRLNLASNNTQQQAPATKSKSPPEKPQSPAGSSLSGWSSDSSGSGGGGGSPPTDKPSPISLAEMQQQGPNDDDFGAEYYNDNEIYDPDFYNIEDEEHNGGVCSENEEEEEEEEDSDDDGDDQEIEQHIEDTCDVIDLCASPEPAAAAEEKENEENPLPPQANKCICQVCDADLSSFHYLHQIQHVKQCLSKKNVNSSKPPPPLAENPPANSKKRKLLLMDIKDWLKELNFEAHIDKFIAEEIDMSIVHALDETDLDLLGITQLLEKRRFLRAAKKVGEEVTAAKRARGVNKTKKQQTLQLPGMKATTTGGGGGSRPGNNNLAANRVQSAEQSLLSSLYPKSNVLLHNNFLDEEEETENFMPMPTPTLPPTAVLTTGLVVVDPKSSLFTSASRCQLVTESLEARLEKRRQQQPPKEEEGLGRGGIKFTRHEESRAIKAMKLQALKEELKVQEETVAELRKLVNQLEAELGVKNQ